MCIIGQGKSSTLVFKNCAYKNSTIVMTSVVSLDKNLTHLLLSFRYVSPIVRSQIERGKDNVALSLKDVLQATLLFYCPCNMVDILQVTFSRLLSHLCAVMFRTLFSELEVTGLKDKLGIGLSVVEYGSSLISKWKIVLEYKATLVL